MRCRRDLLSPKAGVVGIEQEEVRAAEAADEGGVGDDPALRLPQMQVIAGRFQR